MLRHILQHRYFLLRLPRPSHLRLERLRFLRLTTTRTCTLSPNLRLLSASPCSADAGCTNLTSRHASKKGERQVLRSIRLASSRGTSDSPLVLAEGILFQVARRMLSRGCCSSGRAPLRRSRHTKTSCASTASLRRTGVGSTCGPISLTWE
jgi:hypothetical protein